MGFLGYALPPFALVGKCLQKVRREKRLTIDSSSSMAVTSLVPFPSRILGPKPSTNSDVQRHTPRSFRLRPFVSNFLFYFSAIYKLAVDLQKDEVLQCHMQQISLI